MKLIGDNAGRNIILWQHPTFGVGAQQQLDTSTPIVLSSEGSIQIGQDTFNQGDGAYLGILNGVPVFSLGNVGAGLSWDGNVLNITGNLVALGATISGDVNVGTGGDIRSGMTAFMVGTGFWLAANSGNPQFAVGNPAGDYMSFDTATGRVVINVPNGAVYAVTATMNDTANLGSTATWGQISGTPTTLAGYGITDGQSALGSAPGPDYILSDDGNGNHSWVQHYGNNCTTYGDILTDTAVTSTTFKNWGGTNVAISVANPGVSVTILADINGFVNNDTANVNVCRFSLEYSTDGGTNWSSPSSNQASTPATSGYKVPVYHAICVNNVTPTGDISVRCVVSLTSGTNSMTFTNGTIRVQVVPNNTGYTVNGVLSITVPATSSQTATTSPPATTATTVKLLKSQPTGGTTPYTAFSWAKVSGTGTLTNTTSQTVTITDTETTAVSPGNTATTTVNCTVTDSQTYATSSGSAAASVATVVLASPHGIAVGDTFNVSGVTPAAYNKTGAIALAGTTGSTVKYALSSTPGVITVNGTLNNVQAISGNSVFTGTYIRAYSAVLVTISGANPTCSRSTAGSCTASSILTSNPSGGDGGPYTYSNVKTGGSSTASITAGSTSQNFTVSDTHAASGSPGATTSATFQSTATDGHSNSGNGSKTVTFTFVLDP